MGMSGGIGDFLGKAFDKAKDINGKIVGEDDSFIKSELARTNKEAWVSHMVEQYLKHETVDSPPPEFQIVMEDIIKEISKREIKKIFGE